MGIFYLSMVEYCRQQPMDRIGYLVTNAFRGINNKGERIWLLREAIGVMAIRQSKKTVTFDAGNLLSIPLSLKNQGRTKEQHGDAVNTRHKGYSIKGEVRVDGISYLESLTFRGINDKGERIWLAMKKEKSKGI